MAKDSSSSGTELRVAQEACTHPPPPAAPPSFCAQAKIQKYNINKIYQIELRLKEMTYLQIELTLKEMTYLMIIAETKKTFSTFQFFHQHQRYTGSGKLITVVRVSNLKGQNYGHFLIHQYKKKTLQKNKSSRKNEATESCFYKTANVEL